MLRTRTWVPGRAVPWGLGRLPWAPGAPPRGSQGGGPGPKLQGPIPFTSTCRPFKFASKIMSILMSIFGRSWVPLGSHVLACWRLFRPKLVSEPSSNRLIFEKVICHETLCFLLVVGKIDLHMGPRSTQDRSKTGPRSSWIASFSSSLFTSIFDRFGVGFGAVLASQMEPPG